MLWLTFLILFPSLLFHFFYLTCCGEFFIPFFLEVKSQVITWWWRRKWSRREREREKRSVSVVLFFFLLSWTKYQSAHHSFLPEEEEKTRWWRRDRHHHHHLQQRQDNHISSQWHVERGKRERETRVNQLTIVSCFSPRSLLPSCWRVQFSPSLHHLFPITVCNDEKNKNKKRRPENNRKSKRQRDINRDVSDCTSGHHNHQRLSSGSRRRFTCSVSPLPLSASRRQIYAPAGKRVRLIAFIHWCWWCTTASQTLILLSPSLTSASGNMINPRVHHMIPTHSLLHPLKKDISFFALSILAQKSDFPSFTLLTTFPRRIHTLILQSSHSLYLLFHIHSITSSAFFNQPFFPVLLVSVDNRVKCCRQEWKG